MQQVNNARIQYDRRMLIPASTMAMSLAVLVAVPWLESKKNHRKSGPPKVSVDRGHVRSPAVSLCVGPAIVTIAGESFRLPVTLFL